MNNLNLQETSRSPLILHFCPVCNRPSIKMKLLKEEWQGELPYHVEKEKLSREILRCKCGTKLTWWLMKMKSSTDSQDSIRVHFN